MDWKQVAGEIAKAAPMVGSLIGGPAGAALGGIVAGVASLFGLTPEEAKKDPQKLLQAIQADPDAALKLRKFEMDHEMDLRKLLIQQDQMYLQDIQNARARQVEVEKATGKRDVNLYALAWLIVAGFFGLTALLTFRTIPAESNQAVGILFGGLVAGFTGVVHYFFGSSSSSREKTKLLAGGNKS